MMLKKEGIEMNEFGATFCGDEKVDSYVYGNGRIAGGWKTRNLEITQLVMFSFMESVGDHRSWIVEFTTRSVLGVNLVKIQRSIARCLVSTNRKATARYNDLVRKLFENFNYHVCKISGIFLPAICQVLCSINDVQNNRSIVHIMADHSRKRHSVNGCTVGLNRNTKSFRI